MIVSQKVPWNIYHKTWHDKVAMDEKKVLNDATEKCQKWGYTSAERFTSYRHCFGHDPILVLTKDDDCTYAKYTVKFQLMLYISNIS